MLTIGVTVILKGSKNEKTYVKDMERLREKRLLAREALFRDNKSDIVFRIRFLLQSVLKMKNNCGKMNCKNLRNVGKSQIQIE